MASHGQTASPQDEVLLDAQKDKRELLSRLSSSNSPTSCHKRKERSTVGQPTPDTRDQRPSKRARTSPCPQSRTSTPKPTNPEPQASKAIIDPVQTWVESEKWPNDLFKPDSHAGSDFFADESEEEDPMDYPSPPVVQYVEINGFRYPRPVPKTPTIRRKQSDASLSGSSEQKKRENKSSAYRDTRYVTLLAAKGSYMHEYYGERMPEDSKNLCRTLLGKDQAVPQDSLFRDDRFERTCRKILDRNEAMIVQDITRLLVPSAENLAIYGDQHLDNLIESVNEGWISSIPVEGPRPQPDYAVGFRPLAFTKEQLDKLRPIIGTTFDTSYPAATYRMYFPFLTCEVKCGAGGLEIADRQNAHSMTVALRAIVELFRMVKREKELHHKILTFSVSHDHCRVRIYGHYAIIDEDKTTFYRHNIQEFNFEVLDGKEKWTTYRFTRNVYDVWMPALHRLICSAIDQLPSINFEVLQASELEPHSAESSGLSQGVGGLLSDASEVGSSSIQGSNLPTPAAAPAGTPNTSVSQSAKAPKSSKRAKRTRTGE
ncbi:MAG: hypothetical protein Q9219_005892 [cf. Caloplaca sp. 3 TL-2023]